MRSIHRSDNLGSKFALLRREHAALQARHENLEKTHASLGNRYKRLIRAMDDNIRLKDRQLAFLSWMRKMSFGCVSLSVAESNLGTAISRSELAKLYQAKLSKSRRTQMKALGVLFHIYRINLRLISQFLFLGPRTLKRYFKRFESGGVDKVLTSVRKKIRKVEDPDYKETLLSILHCPPANFGINRTTWTTKLLSKVMTSQGSPVGHDTVSQIIKHAGYRFRKAREVLTSNDPEYRDKLKNITRILSHLGPGDRFFSIDEFGPFSVKQRGGRRLVPYGTYPVVPQWQRSKGFLIVTAALELSTNQVTHFYSTTKDSQEMIKLLELILENYSSCRRIYFSWDAASWHASKVFLAKVRKVNHYSYRKQNDSPIVKLAPLPARAQFLNVIESIFSGLATAVIHNSDYQSVDQAKAAIDRYFRERNQYFQDHPRRAGKKLWGEELVRTAFKEGQNCKYPRWR